jgi:hypothetical protein
MSKQPINLRGNVINLSSVESDFSTLEILKVGSFDSPSHGKFTITKEMLEQTKKNFDSNTHRMADHDGSPQIPLNFSHDKGGKAAGWIKELELNDEGTILIGKLHLTPSGREAVDNKEFAFASAEFSFKHYDPELNQEFDNVLTGVALTNIPFMKGLKSIELTEINMEQILQLLEGLTDEEKVIISEKIKSMMPVSEPISEEPKIDAEEKEVDAEIEPKIEEKKFSESEIKLTNEISILKKEIEFNELLIDGKVAPIQKEAFIKGDMKEFAEKSCNSLNFQQDSDSKEPKEVLEEKEIKDTEAAEEKVLELAEALCAKDSSLSFAQASKQVLSERSDLNKLINTQ